MSSISLRGIYKIFPGNITAVDNFNLEINENEFIILVGPSGCGKSTTLRMLAGLEDITKGEIYIQGKLVNDVEPKDRNIAMVFQNYALYPHMTVYKNMSFALELKKVPKEEIKEKVMGAAKILDIEHLLYRKPKELSGGQRQRVALGRAMVRNPAAFLLDEPLSNLDAKLRAQMRSEIIKLHKRLKTTFVYVTHDQIEAMTMGDRIVVMNNGVIQQVDTPQHLYDKPCNIFVAGFIGAPQMNFVDVEIKKKGTDICAVFEDNAIKLSDAQANALAAYEGKTVAMGIRPENIHTKQLYQDQSQPFISAKVDIAEMMGAEVILYLLCGNTQFTAKMPSSAAVAADEIIDVSFETEKLRFFDKETEQAIGI